MARARHSRLLPENVRASETVPREALQAPSVSDTSSKAKPIEIFAKLRSFMPLYPMPELPDATDVRTITVASGSSINRRVFFCGNMTRKLPKSYQNFNGFKARCGRLPQAGLEAIQRFSAIDLRCAKLPGAKIAMAGLTSRNEWRGKSARFASNETVSGIQGPSRRDPECHHDERGLAGGPR
jgi:hypothetical protein